MGIYTLLQSALLVVNAIAVLNEERVLKQYGWGRNQVSSDGFKARTMDIIHSVQTVMRIPLLFLNTLMILINILT